MTTNQTTADLDAQLVADAIAARAAARRGGDRIRAVTLSRECAALGLLDLVQAAEA